MLTEYVLFQGVLGFRGVERKTGLGVSHIPFDPCRPLFRHDNEFVASLCGRLTYSYSG
jgi:hypothetical protein